MYNDFDIYKYSIIMCFASTKFVNHRDEQTSFPHSYWECYPVSEL